MCLRQLNLGNSTAVPGSHVTARSRGCKVDPPRLCLAIILFRGFAAQGKRVALNPPSKKEETTPSEPVVRLAMTVSDQATPSTTTYNYYEPGSVAFPVCGRPELPEVTALSGLGAYLEHMAGCRIGRIGPPPPGHQSRPPGLGLHSDSDIAGDPEPGGRGMRGGPAFAGEG